MYYETNKESIVEITPEFISAIQKYDQLGVFSEGYAAVRKGNKWGYINTKGEEVIPATIDAWCVGRFSEGLAFVTKGGEFHIIDTKGQTVFHGKKGLNESEIPESEDMPYFINGFLYIERSEADKYDVYDKQGKKTGKTVTWTEMDSIRSMAARSKVTIIYDESKFVGEEREEFVVRTKFGLKDSVDNVLVSAKYDEIGGRNGSYDDKSLIDISNGVVLVILEELEEDEYTNTDKNGPPRKHYGYADFKGNDTFSENLRERCRVAEQKALDNYQAYLKEEEERFRKEMEEQERFRKEMEEQEYTNDNSPSYTSERIVTIYIRGEFDNQSKITYESNYGISSFSQRERRIITKAIFVPNGKVWIFKNYSFSTSSSFARYHAGFCDDSSWYYVSYGTERENPGNWNSMDNMNGVRLYGGKKIYMYWGTWYGSPTNVTFSLEANFIERDE